MRRMMKIMAGYDGHNAAGAAADMAPKHALAFGARVYVATSLTGDAETSMEAIKKAKQDLESVVETLERNGIPVETHLLIRGLSAGEDLVRFAQEHQIDQAVVGVKKTWAAGKILLGSNARYVILHAACPVLSVKQQDAMIDSGA